MKFLMSCGSVKFKFLWFPRGLASRVVNFSFCLLMSITITPYYSLYINRPDALHEQRITGIIVNNEIQNTIFLSVNLLSPSVVVSLLVSVTSRWHCSQVVIVYSNHFHLPAPAAKGKKKSVNVFVSSWLWGLFSACVFRVQMQCVWHWENISNRQAHRQVYSCSSSYKMQCLF